MDSSVEFGIAVIIDSKYGGEKGTLQLYLKANDLAPYPRNGYPLRFPLHPEELILNSKVKTLLGCRGSRSISLSRRTARRRC
jgi:hypothetical protein